jgi:hypothetical protein
MTAPVAPTSDQRAAVPDAPDELHGPADDRDDLADAAVAAGEPRRRRFPLGLLRERTVYRLFPTGNRPVYAGAGG